MEVKVIKNEKEYDLALKRLDKIFDAKPNTPNGDEFELLSLVIEKYEDENYPIPNPDRLQAIKFVMEQLGMDDSDLGKIIDSRSRVSEIFNKTRKLNLKQIRQINKELHIPAEILIQDY